MTTLIIAAATLLEISKNGVDLKIEAQDPRIDPGRSVFLRVEAKVAPDRNAELPDLRDRVAGRGFSLAEDFAEEPRRLKDGSTVLAADWRLVPEPCAEIYAIRPFVVKVSPKTMSYRTDEGKYSFVAGPVRFEPPAAREPATGGIETDPSKDLPPLSWRLALWCAAALLLAASAAYGAWLALRYLARRVREHRMSPVERAWAELERLLRKGLPGRGRYKDFYVELTMVVRRYVQRRHGVKAPHLTTEEFFEAAKRSPAFGREALEGLMDFLRKADMVKFAGVQATPETADEATGSARAYISRDDEIARGKAHGAA